MATAAATANEEPQKGLTRHRTMATGGKKRKVEAAEGRGSPTLTESENESENSDENSDEIKLPWNMLVAAHRAYGYKRGFPYTVFLLFWKYFDTILRNLLIEQNKMAEDVRVSDFIPDDFTKRPAFCEKRFQKQHCTNSKKEFKDVMNFWYELSLSPTNPFVLRATIRKDIALFIKPGRKLQECIDTLPGFLDDVPLEVFNYLHRNKFSSLYQSCILFGPMSYVEHCCTSNIGFTQPKMMTVDHPYFHYKKSNKNMKKVVQLKLYPPDDSVSDDKSRQAKVYKELNKVSKKERLLEIRYTEDRARLWFVCVCSSCSP